MFNLPANIKALVKDLRKLSEKTKLVIIVVVVIIATLVLGYFWVRDTLDTVSQIGTAVKSESLPNINTIENQINTPTPSTPNTNSNSGAASNTNTVNAENTATQSQTTNTTK